MTEHNERERLLADLRAERDQLRTALEPFARKVHGSSLFISLAHITREDLLRARDAMNGGKPP